MIAYFKDQLENVISDLDSVMHEDMILKVMLFTLIKQSKIKGFSKLMSEEDLTVKLNELSHSLINDENTLNYMLNEFNFDKCIDLLHLLTPPELLLPTHFDLILALF